MGVRQYKLGYKHGLEGVRALAHRLCMPYDSASANRSYHWGYTKGCQERMAKGKVGLNYNNKLNNQLFVK